MLRVVHELKSVSTEAPGENGENHEKCTQKLSPIRHVGKTLDYTAKITPSQVNFYLNSHRIIIINTN